MKKNIRYIPFSLFITLLLFIVACEDKDPYELVNDSKPLVVQANDFNLSVNEGAVMPGDTLGTVLGTSNKGAVSFEMVSQSPENAIAIDMSTGTLTVVNADLFLAETQITGMVAVTKDDITENLGFVITIETVLATCTDPIFNINAWIGNLNVEDVGFGTEPGEGLASVECDELIIAGDLFGFGCDLSPTVILTFIPASEGATSGSVFSTSQPWDCDGTDYFFIFPSGTYDEGTGQILVDYELYQGEELLFPGQLLITQNCDSSVNTNVWSGALDAEDVGFGTVAVTGVAGCGELIIKGDILSFDCTNTPTTKLILTPSSEGSTSGTVIAILQPYDCEEGVDNTMVFPSGTYDETTGEILVDYEYYQDGELSFPGQFLITPQQ